MLDFGWPELFLIIGITVLAIGPDQVPAVLYKFGKLVQRMKYMRFALSQQFDNFMNDLETQQAQKTASEENTAKPGHEMSARIEAEADEDESYILPESCTQSDGESESKSRDQHARTKDAPQTQDMFDGFEGDKTE